MEVTRAAERTPTARWVSSSLSSVGPSHQFLALTSGTCILLASEVGTEPERLRCLLYLLARGDSQEPAKAVVTIGVGLIVSDERENAFRLAHRKYGASG